MGTGLCVTVGATEKKYLLHWAFFFDNWMCKVEGVGVQNRICNQFVFKHSLVKKSKFFMKNIVIFNKNNLFFSFVTEFLNTEQLKEQKGTGNPSSTNSSSLLGNQ